MFFIKTVKAIKAINTAVFSTEERLSQVIGRLTGHSTQLNEIESLLGDLVKAKYEDDLKLLEKPKRVFPGFQEVKGTVNGYIWVTLGNTEYLLMGGPYRNRLETVPGVKLARELNLPCDIKLDIPDFDIPTMPDAEMALYKAFMLLKGTGALYAGCMGGIGRTGMFLALMMRVIWYLEDLQAEIENEEALNPTHPDVVKFIRQNYMSGAIETQRQITFINEFPALKVARFIHESKMFEK